MSDYQLLAERLTRGHRVHYKALREETAKAIITLEADLAALRAQNAQLENDCNMLSLDRQELQERLAEYEDAPVVAWMDKSHDDRDIAVTVDELNRKDQYIQRLWKDATALIVKPPKEGTKP